eukprot:GILK01005761.1.p1 GENE.GILK01005761.1~~GILK01005761.1.p1  ORF type:complete len:147 (-),score=40.76 GILK01005761.1:254-694(-)
MAEEGKYARLKSKYGALSRERREMVQELLVLMEVNKELEQQQGLLLQKLKKRQRAQSEREHREALKDSSAPKKPRNAFVLYCQQNRDKVKEDVPEAAPAELTKVLGQRWHAMEGEDKQKYYDLFQEDRTRYYTELQQYNSFKEMDA